MNQPPKKPQATIDTLVIELQKIHDQLEKSTRRNLISGGILVGFGILWALMSELSQSETGFMPGLLIVLGIAIFFRL